MKSSALPEWQNSARCQRFGIVTMHCGLARKKIYFCVRHRVLVRNTPGELFRSGNGERE